MAVSAYANRVLMNVKRDPEFDLEEYSFGAECFPIDGMDYRLVISKRFDEYAKKDYYVVSTKAHENDMFPKPVPDFMAVSWEDELDSIAFTSAEKQLGDTGASLWETYEEAAEAYCKIAYRMSQEKRDAEVRGSLKKVRKVSCRSCGAEKDRPYDHESALHVAEIDGGPMFAVKVRPYALTDSGICREHNA